MNTAEVAIEHVLAGLLALAAFVLPLLPVSEINRESLSNEAIVGVLGLAYLFGVVFDRHADTLLSPIERRLRLHLAHDWCKEKQSVKDPFPQDHLEFSLRGAGDARVQWMESLRGRIRTSRALAVLGLPAAMGLALHQNQSGFGYRGWPHLAVALALMFMLSLVVGLSYYKPTRTDELCGSDAEDKELLRRADTMAWLPALLYYFPVLGLFVLTASMAPAPKPGTLEVIHLLIGGVITATMALLAWYRITATYMSFVHREIV